MAMERRHPAVVAGLAGTVVALAPTTALAVGESLPSQHEVLQFGLGVVVGAAAATAVSLAITHPRATDQEEDAEARATADEAPAGGPAGTAEELGATEGGRLAVHVDDAEDDTDRLVPVGDGAGAPVPRQPEPTRAQRIAAKAPDPLADDGGDVGGRLGDKTQASRAARRTRSVREVLAERLGADPFDDVPVIERADGTVGDVGTSWWNSRLGDSVRHVGTIDSALASIGPWDQPSVLDVAREVDRAEVTAALLARSNPKAADASAATSAPKAVEAPRAASVPRAAAVPSAAGDTDELLGMWAVAKGPRQAKAPSAAAPAPTRQAAPSAERPLTASERSERALRIARLVPEVDQGAFPEHRSASELDEDLWDQALKAMGERMEQEASQAQPYAGVVTAEDAEGAMGGMPAPVAAAVPVAGAADQAPTPRAALAPKAVPDPLDLGVENPDDTIDEPEGLEPPTQFLTFRAPAGHPEVTDADSYVDYLVRDEMSRSRSKVIRSKAHDYLQVIDGGTSVSSTNRMRRAKPHGAPEGSRHARHARADLPEAQEA